MNLTELQTPNNEASWGSCRLWRIFCVVQNPELKTGELVSPACCFCEDTKHFGIKICFFIIHSKRPKLWHLLSNALTSGKYGQMRLPSITKFCPKRKSPVKSFDGLLGHSNSASCLMAQNKAVPLLESLEQELQNHWGWKGPLMIACAQPSAQHRLLRAMSRDRISPLAFSLIFSLKTSSCMIFFWLCNKHYTTHPKPSQETNTWGTKTALWYPIFVWPSSDANRIMKI